MFEGVGIAKALKQAVKNAATNQCNYLYLAPRSPAGNDCIAYILFYFLFLWWISELECLLDFINGLCCLKHLSSA